MKPVDAFTGSMVSEFPSMNNMEKAIRVLSDLTCLIIVIP